MLICTSYQEVSTVTSEEQNVNLTLNLYPFSSPSQESPPTHSRLPPDGHEFPVSYTDGSHERVSSHHRYSPNFDQTPASRSNLNKRSGDARSRWRRNDEKSEKSVKDKIAMFSTETARKHLKLQRADSLGSDGAWDNGESEKVNDVISPSHLKQALVRKSSVPEKSTTSKSRGEHRGGSQSHSTSPTRQHSVRSVSSDSEERRVTNINNSNSQASTIVSPNSAHNIEAPSGLSTRSQSLVDIDKSTRVKRHSVGAYDRPLAYKFGIEKPEEKERRTSLTNLIEKRRKSISKLRCLVIPEAKIGETGQRVPLDLPKISSHTAVKSMSLPREDAKPAKLYKTDSISSLDSWSSCTSKNSSVLNPYNGQSMRKATCVLPKKLIGTSHASLPLGHVRNRSPCSDISTSSPSPRVVSPQRNFERETTPVHDSGFEFEQRFPKAKSIHTPPHKASLGSSSSRVDDSDNDSAVSSTQSSFSQSLSPRASPMPDHSDQEECHLHDRVSRHRHSSQSSYDECDNKRVLKNGTVEAENRRNILKSAKCSSGRSSDEYSTPEPVRKFSPQSRITALTTTPVLLDRVPNRNSSKRNLRRESSSNSTTTTTTTRTSPQESVTQKLSKDLPNVTAIKSSNSAFTSKIEPTVQESQIKIAYLNEVVENFEELKESNNMCKIIAEIPLSKDIVDGNSCTLSSNPPYNYAASDTSTVSYHSTSSSTSSSANNNWDSLERKYTPKQTDFGLPQVLSPTDRPVSRTRAGVASQKTDFQSVASKWKQRTEEDPNPRQPQHQVSPKGSLSKSPNVKEVSDSSSAVVDIFTIHQRGHRPTNLEIARSELPDRKFSVPEYGRAAKMREKKDANCVSSRPTSLIEGSNTLMPLQPDSQYMISPSSPSSESTYTPEHSMSRAASKEVLNAFAKPQNAPRMSDVMRAFERKRKNISNFGSLNLATIPLDVNLNGETSPGVGIHYGSAGCLAAAGTKELYGSINSLASSTSLISPQELASMIEEANQSLEESGTPSHEIIVVVLHRELIAHGSIGVTLAGGADYDAKEITVRKIIPGSLADRDGRIQKGDRVLSINGKTLRQSSSHREALHILKSPRPEVVLVLSRSRSVTPQESTLTNANGDLEIGFNHRSVIINQLGPSRPPKILESPMDSKSLASDIAFLSVPRSAPQSISLVKDGAGLGFSLEGGKDSPLGDRPLIIKKIFTGGAADKGAILRVGDELRSVNNIDLSDMARIEAWNFLKKLPDGTVVLVIRKKLPEDTTLPKPTHITS